MIVDKKDVAFVVSGFSVTATERDAGIAAMVGQFTKTDVVAALVRAGVPTSVPGNAWLADRAADRLLQAERKRRRIRPVHNKLWEQTP